MKPAEYKILIALMIIGGLIITNGCGGSGSGTGSGSSGGGVSGGVTITNEVSAPSEMGVGDIMMLQYSTGETAEFDFEGVEDGSSYYVAVGSLDYDFGSHSVSVMNNAPPLGSYKSAVVAGGVEEIGDDWENWSVSDAFDQHLRNVEAELAADYNLQVAEGDNFYSGAKAAMVEKSASVGDTESFRVLNSLSSLSSYKTVTGRVKCVEENVIIYLDTEVESTNPADITDSDIESLCTEFNDQAALEESWFGAASDVNSDGKVAALLTPQVNRLGSMGGGIITGFFLASDLYSRSGSNAISNEREIVYTLVPDSSGVYGLTIPKSFAIENLLTAVLPHEFQHAISYNQHVFLGEGTTEDNWLNEGMSHLAEDLVGYGQENYSRAEIFLDSPTSYALVNSGSPGLGERGEAYLFMRFLYEQSSDKTGFLWGLYHNNTGGVANLEAAYNGSESNFDQFGEFFMRWMAALAMTDRGLSVDDRYVYDTRVYNSDTERWEGVCLVCDSEDGRGTVMNGPAMSTYSGVSSFSIYSSGVKFFDVASAPATMTFTSSSSGTFGVVLIRKE